MRMNRDAISVPKSVVPETSSYLFSCPHSSLLIWGMQSPHEGDFHEGGFLSFVPNRVGAQ